VPAVQTVAELGFSASGAEAINCAQPAPAIFFGVSHMPESKLLCNGATNALNKLAAKIAKVCCDRLLWAHSANLFILSIFFGEAVLHPLACCALSNYHLRGSAPILCYATVYKRAIMSCDEQPCAPSSPTAYVITAAAAAAAVAANNCSRVTGAKITHQRQQSSAA